MKKIIIAAVSTNNVIGSNSKIPWYNEEELEYFKETTIYNAVLMGRKTFESIGKILPNRINIVVSRKTKETDVANNLFFFSSIDDAIRYAKKLNVEKLFIIGGSEIYSQTISMVDELLISRIPLEIEGDKYFPIFDSEIWKAEETIEYKSFTIEKYKKQISKI
jgi:dihydrofolate reductase